MAQTKFSPDSLIQGIESITSKNRSSFSDDEIKLLQECVETLKEYKLTLDKESFIEVTTKFLSVFTKPEVVTLINDWIHYWAKN